MKKSILFWMCVVLCLLAAGCSNSPETNGDGAAEGNAVTEEPATIDDVPTLPPDEALVNEIAPADYRYEQLSSNSGNLTLDYPSHWTRTPGTSTVCFAEPVPEGKAPARFTLTKKTLDASPNSDKKTSQLASFVKRVVQDFDSYEISPLSTNGSFLGDKAAYYVTYTVQKEGVTLKGYVIMATKDKTLYVFHFRSNVTEYEAFNPVMTRIRDSITLN